MLNSIRFIAHCGSEASEIVRPGGVGVGVGFGVGVGVGVGFGFGFGLGICGGGIGPISLGLPGIAGGPGGGKGPGLGPGFGILGGRRASSAFPDLLRSPYCICFFAASGFCSQTSSSIRFSGLWKGSGASG